MALSFKDSLNKDSVYSAYLEEQEVKWTVDDGYDTYGEYTDDSLSTVSMDKNVYVEGSQVNMTQEDNSQYIPFEMPRYYEGIDLTTMKIFIHFVGAEGSEGRTAAVDVKYSDNKIRFAWLVDRNATADAGTLNFEIEAIGVNSKGKHYCWKSRPNSELNVEKSLSGNGFVRPDNSWLSEFMDLVLDEVARAKKYADNAKKSEENAKLSEEEAARCAEKSCECARQSADSAAASEQSNTESAQSAAESEASALRAEKAAQDLIGTDSAIKAAEEARVQAEKEREQEFAELKTDAQAATDRANEAAQRAEDAAGEIRKQDAYGSGMPIQNGANLDEIKDLGRYHTLNAETSASLVNTPITTSGFTMVVEGTYGSVTSDEEVSTCMQRVFNSDNTVEYRRVLTAEGWSDWKEVFSMGNNKPLPISEGGTGASTDKAAEFNLIDPASDDSAITDEMEVVAIHQAPNADNGRLKKFDALKIWEYVKSKMVTDKLTLTDGCIARRNGKMVSITVAYDATFDDGTIPLLLGTLPEGWRPSEMQANPVIMQEVPTSAYIKVDTNGEVYIDNSSATYKPGNVWVKGSITFILD